MKRITLVFSLVILFSLAVVGAVMANGTTEINQSINPDCPTCLGDGAGYAGSGSGYLHDYMNTALANVLGMDVDEFNSRQAAGETLYDIAADLGIDLTTLVELRNQARLEAIELAYADGVLTDDQYQFMLERAQSSVGMGFGMGGGNGRGTQQGGGGGGYGRGQHGGGMLNADGTPNYDCPNYQAVP